ncbi:U32 family peptidase [Desulfovibrio sp. OttesenSCG-928-G15]|nr:U32 family peptidase [Desulfovibrio sp. OttesenSCG-928-G15]
MNTTLPELLAPAGNMDKFRTALLYGADAVYLGGLGGNLRAACEGFDPAALRVAVAEANALGRRIYYCLNSFALESDLAVLPQQVEDAAEAGVHAFIIADPGVLALARRYAPAVPVHLSTQANTMNSAAAAFWREQGVSRVNLARELGARSIRAVRKALPDMELEVFVHGAMCLALSGQCLLSAWLNARSGNQGRCTQPCRFAYRALDEHPATHSPLPSLVVEEYTRKGEALWRVEQEEPFSSFWATQDLCLLPWLSWFTANRIDGIKVEGRMKSAGWLAHSVDAYRTALDSLAAGRLSRAVLENCLEEALLAATRSLGTGFFLHRRRDISREFLERRGLAARPDRNGQTVLPDFGRSLVGRVLEPEGLGVWAVEVLGNWRQNMDVEIMLPGLRRPVLAAESYGLENAKGELVRQVGNGTRCRLYADVPDIGPGIFLRCTQF